MYNLLSAQFMIPVVPCVPQINTLVACQGSYYGKRWVASGVEKPPVARAKLVNHFQCLQIPYLHDLKMERSIIISL